MNLGDLPEASSGSSTATFTLQSSLPNSSNRPASAETITINNHTREMKAIPPRDPYERLDHKYYRFACGQIQDSGLHYLTTIEDHNSEACLEHISWIKNSSYLSYFSEKNIESLYDSEVPLGELIEVISSISSNEISTLLEYAYSSSSLWPQYGVTGDDCIKFSLVLAVYTGSDSEALNMNCSLQIKESFLQKGQTVNRSFEVLNGYLIRAISYLPYYWGVSVRCTMLSLDDLDEYRPGVVMTWLQFSSSSKGEQPAEFAENRNTRFFIYSVTGRDISEFSMCHIEREVIFLPYSQFVVFKKEIIDDVTFIYLRQINLGISDLNVLWVDDHILEPEWENKIYMECTSRKNQKIKFIPKISTDCAISYLKSIWGVKHKNEIEPRFRIISDMNRPNEPNSASAGAVFLKQVIDLGFVCPMMIFTSSAHIAKAILNEQGLGEASIEITSCSLCALNFISFNQSDMHEKVDISTSPVTDGDNVSKSMHQILPAPECEIHKEYQIILSENEETLDKAQIIGIDKLSLNKKQIGNLNHKKKI